VSYRIQRLLTGYEAWETVAEITTQTTTVWRDYYAGNSVNYTYAVRAVTTKVGVGIELESGDDPLGGSKQDSQLSSTDWSFVGEDRSLDHVINLVVTDENHTRPIQQESFETIGSDRKVIMRGFVLGHEGTLTTFWQNTLIPFPTDEQLTINETLQGRRIVDYLTHNAGPHIIKSPFGDVWDAQFETPEYSWLPVGHLEVTLKWVETGNTSRELF
jgi:hypothetical protein